MASRSSIEKDYSIIRELVVDPRQSNVSLAEKVGLSEGSVRRRVARLQEEGHLHFAAIPAAAYMGRPVHTMFRIQSAPGMTDQLIDALVDMPEMAYVYQNTGQFDITAVGYFSSSEDMRKFATDQLGHLDGLVEMHTIMVLRVAKRAHEWASTVAVVAEDDPVSSASPE
jgi:Lrp/AsnC family transcriptional regulator for asnA, asnC and gidA